MNQTIMGLHHITAIAGSVQGNYDFYTAIMGLRMVKRTVNFDDPGTYHFYYGDRQGTPGTILTFFPWEGVDSGRNGTGMATEIGYAVPQGSLGYWVERFKRYGVVYSEPVERFGEQVLSFRDPDGLMLALIVPAVRDDRQPWETAEVKADSATRGFHTVTLTLRNIEGTVSVLTDIFGYRLLAQEGSRYRFITDAVRGASMVDILETPDARVGFNGAGVNHHVAFRVADENIQLTFREKIFEMGLHITPKIDRDYFYSVYFREPGGVLFEIATDNPGFTVDEPLTELGSHLKLPKQFEPVRNMIETELPPLSIA